MLDLLIIYKWSLLAGLLSGGMLALVGVEIISRGGAVKAFVISQAASFGIVLGLSTIIIFLNKDSHHYSFLPTMIGFLFAYLIDLLCNRLSMIKNPVLSSYYIAIYAILLSLTYIVISQVPSLESHMISSFFGDISFVTYQEAVISGLFNIVFLLFYLKYKNNIFKFSFYSSVLIQSLFSNNDKKINQWFLFLSLVLMVISIQYLGLLFTLSCLFIPALCLHFFKLSMDFFRWGVVIVTIMGVFLGFIVSLSHGELPTVPVITLTLIMIGLLFSFILSKK